MYLWIKDLQVEIRDASHLWGLEIMDTDPNVHAVVMEISAS